MTSLVLLTLASACGDEVPADMTIDPAGGAGGAAGGTAGGGMTAGGAMPNGGVAGQPSAGAAGMDSVAGAAGAGVDGPSYAATVEPYIVASCVNGCHSPGGFGGPNGSSDQSQLDLSMGVGHTALTTGTSTQVPGMAFVGATAESSYLLTKMSGLQTTGLPMPLGAAAPPEQQEAVRAWIEGGALP